MIYIILYYAEVFVAMHKGPMSSCQMHIIFVRFYPKLGSLGSFSVLVVKVYFFDFPVGPTLLLLGMFNLEDEINEFLRNILYHSRSDSGICCEI